MNNNTSPNSSSAFVSTGSESYPSNFQTPVVTPTTGDHFVSLHDPSSSLTPRSGCLTPTTMVPLPKFVKLNVGGVKYETSRATLCSVPKSHLEAMFSGRHSMEELQTDDGSYFIDRDGRHFRHVLNYLRTGCVITLPDGDNAKEELAIEADFYGLEGLVKAIRMPKKDLLDCLPGDTLLHWEAEAKLRSAFADGDAKNFCKTDPFRGLAPLFPVNGQNDECLHELPLKFDPNSEVLHRKETLFMTNLRSNGDNENKNLAVTAKDIDEFKTNFNKEWPNVLHRLQDVLLEEPIILAGGSVLRALTASQGIRTANWWVNGNKVNGTSDIDVFLYGCDREEANRIARRIFYALSWDNEKWAVVRSRGVCNMYEFRTGLKIQVVLRIYDSPTEVLIGFDIDSCCCAYDGKNVWVCPRWISALKSGVNILNPLHAWPNKASYEFRLAKYAFRGFAVSVPGIDKNRIDYDLIHRSDIDELRGLARLLKIASEMETAPPKRGARWDRQERRNVYTERPRTPRQLTTLRRSEVDCTSEDLRVIEALDLSYDHDEDSFLSKNVLVPEVYRNEEGVEWTFTWDSYPVALECRDRGWAEIEDGGEDHPEFVTRLLVDAWDTSKRSREYLNGQMDKYDLDNIYYSKAYNEDNGDL